MPWHVRARHMWASRTPELCREAPPVSGQSAMPFLTAFAHKVNEIQLVCRPFALEQGRAGTCSGAMLARRRGPRTAGPASAKSKHIVEPMPHYAFKIYVRKMWYVGVATCDEARSVAVVHGLLLSDCEAPPGR